MHIVVVYESMFGNTRQVAEAIADSIRPVHSVWCQPVGSADPTIVSTADLLIIGAPTHAWSLSRPTTRQGAADQASEPDSHKQLEPDATGIGLREWLEREDPLPSRAAVFDTRRNISPLLSGRAGRAIKHLLHQHGVKVVAGPVSFLVDADNQLVPGELERAASWGREITAHIEPLVLRGHRDDLL
ncbi:Flavodoxin domain-containing protein [Nakamurella panacisegetis]|uniref:Flavodoxin domain-containing protein n=1 Tax=Nakamurella panacisegetis TaxID=1090615 RepID=A0A1H0S8W4_9ACTN|nr:flavodoxin domain-containing protein [Nakamurella panacisegetis]SDP38222.1 Flavodoxin domain-containing protein [Nakamurella panacisegetis]